jgi:choline kinase
MVRSLFAVGPTISTTVIVSYSDIVYSPHAVSELISSSHALAVTYDVNWRELWTARFADPTSDAEEFRIDGAGCILEIGARVSSISTVQGQFMGLLRIEPNMWKQLWATVDAMAPAEADRLDTTSLLRLAIQRGMKVHGIAYNEPWAEVDTLADLRLYEEDSRFHKLRTMLDSLHEDRLTSSDAAGGAAGQEEN